MPPGRPKRYTNELVELMNGASLTIDQAAEMMGVKRATIEAYRRPPTSKMALECPPRRLMALKIAIELEQKKLTKGKRKQLERDLELLLS